MPYHLDPASMSLDDLRRRFESTDLIPSHQPLLQGIRKKFLQLEKAGILSVAVLRVKLKTNKALSATALATRVDPDYLALLRRAVEGFFPKPLPLRAFEWLDQSTITQLQDAGIADSAALLVAVTSSRATLLKKTGIKVKVLAEVASLSDLVRIQWVSPTFARVLLAAGFRSAEAVAAADPEALYAAVSEANADSQYYKGKIGLRDMKRVGAAAAHVPNP